MYNMKRMLFNATQAEELRVAIVDGQKLIDLDIESASKEQRKSNIYKGIITRVEPSLEAAFIDYGQDRHGFLPLKEVARAFMQGADGEGTRGRPQDLLKEGQELIVQVEKDERGNKGAALTTFISLAGRYLVLMPNNPRGGGVSRRIEGEERDELREVMAQLGVPQGMSVIARTAGIGRNLEELQWDLNYLLQLWSAIEGASKQQSGAYLIYQESSLVIRAIRDYFHPEIGEILIDTEEIYEQARQFMAHVMPANVNRVKLYADDVPLFSRFQIEHQIETAYSREVALPSGGAIVIDHTEALVSVDVNSARATRGSDIEQTALNTNLEAAEETARQLRLRDLGGLVVIDFIDMESQRNQREVENRLRDALHYDRARVQTGKISRFGLLELSRQRLQPSLGETSHIPCPRCHGTGHIRGTESTALHILRIIQEEAMKENTAAIHAQVPVDVATFLLNEKRSDIHAVESRMKVDVVLIPNLHLETPNYTISRLRHDELNRNEPLQPSYKMVEKPAEESESQKPSQEIAKPRPQAAVQGITPAQPAPIREEAAKPSIFGKLFGWLKNIGEEKKEEPKPKAHREQPRREREGNRPRRDRNDRSPRSGQSSEGGKQEPRATEKPTQKQPRQPRPAPAEQAAIAAKPEAAQEGAAESGEQQRAKRGRRGGRRERGERKPREAQTEVQQTVGVIESQVEQTKPIESPTQIEAVQMEATKPMPPVDEEVKSAPVVTVAESPVVEAPRVVEIAPVTAPAPAEPLVARVANKPKPSTPELVQIETQHPTQAAVEATAKSGTAVESKRRPARRPAAATESSGPAELMQIETSADKLKLVSESRAEEIVMPTTPRPQRPHMPPLEAESLVQVETGK
jgi:ribonuclease E